MRRIATIMSLKSSEDPPHKERMKNAQKAEREDETETYLGHGARLEPPD